MVKRLLCLALSAMLVLCAPVTAFAEGTTPTPRLDCTSFMCDEESKTSSGYKWDYVVLSYSDPETGETHFYSKDAKVKLYTSSSGGGTANDISVKVNTSRDARGKLCIGHIDLSASNPPSKSTSYYLAVTESGKAESSRIKITVKPFENTESLIQKITGESYAVFEDEVDGKQQALDILLSKLRSTAEGSGISISCGDILSYTAAAYGKNGRLDAKVYLSSGDSAKATLVIIANEYDGPMPQSSAEPKPSAEEWAESLFPDEWLEVETEEQSFEVAAVGEEPPEEAKEEREDETQAEEQEEEQAEKMDNSRIVPLDEIDSRIPKTG